MTVPPSTNRSSTMDDADEAARRLIAIDEGAPDADDEIDYLDAISVAREYLARRARMVRDGAGCGCHWTYADANDAEGTQTVECARHREQRIAIIEWCAAVADRKKLGEGQMLSGTALAAVHDGACADIARAIRALPAPPAKDQT